MRTSAFFLLVFFALCSVSQASLSWEYDSLIEVMETITDVGDGVYQYEYSFKNIDSSPIWAFGIYTYAEVQPQGGFNGHQYWTGPTYITASQIQTHSDPSVLDPGIEGLFYSSYEFGPPHGLSDAIQIDESVSGFSYTTSFLDPSPKYYYYITVATGGSEIIGTGMVSAVGTTIPEPCSLLLFSTGLLVLLRRNGTRAHWCY